MSFRFSQYYKVITFFIAVILWGGTINLIKAEALTIYAAVSTINVIQEISKHFAQQNSIKVQTSFASSSTLAKQIAQGAPVHIFLSANPLWMDYLEKQQLLIPQSRFHLFYNQLVLITPQNQTFEVQWEEFDLPKAFEGRFSIGDPRHVPAGIYAKEALEYFHWWAALKSRAVRTHNVRAALTFVERGEVAMGIVYATDAKISKHVKIVGIFPKKSYSPIMYPIALIGANEHPFAHQFLQFLQTPESLNIYKHHGFVVK